jgi:hypothetical protein
MIVDVIKLPSMMFLNIIVLRSIIIIFVVVVGVWRCLVGEVGFSIILGMELEFA